MQRPPVVRVLCSTALLWLVAGAASLGHAGEGDLQLWYDEPAREWVEALPLGNGRIGAMLFGGVLRERLALNEDTFWSGGPYDPNPKDVTPQLDDARKRVFAGDYRGAERVINDHLLGRPKSQATYQPIGDLVLEFPGHDSPSSYRRRLDLDTATATVEYESGGVNYKREVFISPVHQVLVLRLLADSPGKVGFALKLESPQRGKVEIEGEDLIVYRGRGPAGNRASAQRLKFDCRAQVRHKGGSISNDGKQLRVESADSATIVLAIGTSFKHYDDVSGDPTAVSQADLSATKGVNYEALKTAHVAEHQRLFRRCSFQLGPEETAASAASLPTDDRLKAFAKGADDPALAALYFQFGRYLLISSSRPGTQPANLQGIWNAETNPPWGSKYTININTEMNYWAADVTNLGELVEPLKGMVKDISERGAQTAKAFYGADGWVTYHNTDLWRATAPVDGAFWGYWPLGGAWLTVELWRHYEFTHDEEFLAEIYPMMRGACTFFSQTLVEHPKYGWLVTCPSNSPENGHPEGTSICAGPTMDMAILRDLFQATAQAAEVLGRDEQARQQWLRISDQLAPLQVGKSGQLMEWLQDWDDRAPDTRHRHVSHLYALYPSSQITLRGTPRLARAAAVSLDKRGDLSTGWAIAWRLNLWARLQEGDRAHRILKALLDPSRTYPNLFDAHPPFQIDGNFGGVSGIAEMLLQSNAGEIELLPALPAAWPEGSVTGLRARGGIEVDLVWKAGSLQRATLRGQKDAEVVVRYNGQTQTLKLAPGKPLVVNSL